MQQGRSCTKKIKKRFWLVLNFKCFYCIWCSTGLCRQWKMRISAKASVHVRLSLKQNDACMMSHLILWVTLWVHLVSQELDWTHVKPVASRWSHYKHTRKAPLCTDTFSYTHWYICIYFSQAGETDGVTLVRPTVWDDIIDGQAEDDKQVSSR